VEAVTLSISVIALVIAVIAFVRTGGMVEVKHGADTARERTADILDRLEQIVRSSEEKK
jgi:hypothetical protein